jgi:hypothetical protein
MTGEEQFLEGSSEIFGVLRTYFIDQSNNLRIPKGKLSNLKKRENPVGIKVLLVVAFLFFLFIVSASIIIKFNLMRYAFISYFFLYATLLAEAYFLLRLITRAIYPLREKIIRNQEIPELEILRDVEIGILTENEIEHEVRTVMKLSGFPQEKLKSTEHCFRYLIDRKQALDRRSFWLLPVLAAFLILITICFMGISPDFFGGWGSWGTATGLTGIGPFALVVWRLVSDWSTQSEILCYRKF